MFVQCESNSERFACFSSTATEFQRPFMLSICAIKFYAINLFCFSPKKEENKKVGVEILKHRKGGTRHRTLIIVIVSGLDRAL